MVASQKLIKAARNGGNLPKRRNLEGPGAAVQLELVSRPQEEEKEALTAPQRKPELTGASVADPSLGILITVKSCALKESKNPRKGNKVYRSCTGIDANERVYWWSLDLDEAPLDKGVKVVIQGSLGSPFGDKKNVYPFKTIDSLLPYEEVTTSAKVSTAVDDKLPQKVTELFQQYGISAILKALAEVTTKQE